MVKTVQLLQDINL